MVRVNSWILPPRPIGPHTLLTFTLNIEQILPPPPEAHGGFWHEPAGAHACCGATKRTSGCDISTTTFGAGQETAVGRQGWGEHDCSQKTGCIPVIIPEPVLTAWVG